MWQKWISNYLFFYSYCICHIVHNLHESGVHHKSHWEKSDSRNAGFETFQTFFTQNPWIWLAKLGKIISSRKVFGSSKHDIDQSIFKIRKWIAIKKSLWNILTANLNYSSFPNSLEKKSDIFVVFCENSQVRLFPSWRPPETQKSFKKP